jgi:SAM-dependent methyltransferase
VKDIVKSYADYRFHREIGRLIQRHSENSEDIGHILLRIVDWTEVHDVLDAGCGYGWLEERLPGPFSSIFGIDCGEENREEFLGAARKIARKASFQTLLLPSPIDLPSGSVDLVASIYSLYFFPGAIPELVRLLRSGGRFLVITHSEAMLEEGERFFKFSRLRGLIRQFSAENGESLLRPHFREVEALDYRNGLVFLQRDREDLARYIDFKREFIAWDADPAEVKATILAELDRAGTIRFNKNDRIFIARK